MLHIDYSLQVKVVLFCVSCSPSCRDNIHGPSSVHKPLKLSKVAWYISGEWQTLTGASINELEILGRKIGQVWAILTEAQAPWPIFSKGKNKGVSDRASEWWFHHHYFRLSVYPCWECNFSSKWALGSSVLPSWVLFSMYMMTSLAYLDHAFALSRASSTPESICNSWASILAADINSERGYNSTLSIWSQCLTQFTTVLSMTTTMSIISLVECSWVTIRFIL